MIHTVQNNPEYIKDMASKIISGEYKCIQFSQGRAFGKSSFMSNLAEELMKQWRTNND